MDLQKRLKYIADMKEKISYGIDASKLHSSGKYTAAERMDMLFDSGTFVEIGAFVKKRPTEFNTANADEYEGAVTGYGAVDGSLVFAYAQDFSRQSGVLSEANSRKIVALYDMAIKNGAPIVSIFDSSGSDITEGIDALAGYGAVINRAALCSGIVPQYSLIFGTCAGGQAIIAAMSDFIIMEKKNGKLFVSSPFIIKNSEENAAADIGSASFCAKSGSCAKVAESEVNCFAELKKLMNFIPSNNSDGTNTRDSVADDVNRTTDSIEQLVQSGGYDMKAVITEISDSGGYYEVLDGYSPNTICAFAEIGGISVGIVANQPKENGGFICPGSCDKAEKFIKFCNSFNMPLITLVDTDGAVFSSRAESAKFAECSAKMAMAYSLASVPKITLILGKAYSAAYVLMGSKQLGADVAFAYPTAEIGVLPAETAVNFMYKEEIAKAPQPSVKEAELIDEYLIKTVSPVNAASSGQIDSIIEPSQTRQYLASSLYLLKSKSDLRF